MASRNINNIYEFYRYIVRKQRGVMVTIPQFNTNMDTGQLDAVAEWFSGYGSTQQLHDALRQLRTYQQFTSNFAGFVTFQSDYLHLLGSPFTVTGSTVNEIAFVNESELVNAIKSVMRPLSNSYPVAVDTSTGFSIYPQQTQIGFYFYLRRPATPTLAYTQVGRDITYNSASSTQLEFSDIYVNNIIAKALRYAGVNMDEQGVYAFAEQYNKETQ